MGAVDSIRAALVGYGLGGATFHAPFVARTPGLELAAVVTSDPGRRARALSEHPDVRVVERFDELWRTGLYDLVVISTPNRWHVPLALAALDRGVAVVLDKPMAPTAREGRELVSAAASAGVMLTVFQNRRWDGDFLTLRQLVADGRLGTVRRLESRFERWRPEVRAGSWRELGDPADAGGLLYDLGSHLIDQALVLLGPVSSVYAELDRRRLGAVVDDDTFVALTHRSGARSHLWMSSTAAQLGPRFRVLGSTGAWTSWGLDPQEGQLLGGMQPGAPGFGAVPEAAWGRLGSDADAAAIPMVPGAYQRFWTGVAAALLDGAPAPVDPSDAVAGLEVIEAAQRSASTGQVVVVG